MEEIQFDSRYVALKLIEALYHKGMVNKETFENVKEKYPEAFKTSGGAYWEAQLGHSTKKVKGGQDHGEL